MSEHDEKCELGAGEPWSTEPEWCFCDSRALAVAREERDAALSQVASLREALARRIPDKHYGPWVHADGCDAEQVDGANYNCTCGVWGRIDADHALLASTSEAAARWRSETETRGAAKMRAAGQRACEPPLVTDGSAYQDGFAEGQAFCVRALDALDPATVVREGE